MFQTLAFVFGRAYLQAMSKDTHLTSVRLPSKLHRALVKLAERERRTVNNLITVALEQYVADAKADA